MILLSKSRMLAFLQCPEKYRLAYEVGLRPRKADPALVEGSCLHHLVASALVAGHRLESDSFLALANNRFWETAPFELCDYLDYDNYRAAQQRCLTEAKQFLKLLGDLSCLSMEQYVAVPLTDPRTTAPVGNIGLQGYVDLVADIGAQRHIIDLKTTTRKPRAGLSLLSLELTFYAYLVAYPKFGEISVAYLHLIRTQEPKVLWDSSIRGFLDYLELVTVCQQVALNIQEQRFWRQPGVHCSWCDYRPLCFQDLPLAREKFGHQAVARYYQTRSTIPEFPLKEITHGNRSSIP